jgi:hypothetical protein
MTKEIIKMPLYHSNILRYILEASESSRQILVLLDLDDVVLTTIQYACGSIWYPSHRETNKHIKAPHHILEDFYYCASRTEYKPVSSQLIADFSNLPESITVLGFTARSEKFASETIEHTKHVGMKFSTTLQHEDYPSLKDGIIFVGATPTATPGDKGEALLAFLSKKILTNVQSVFFIDDNLKHVEEVYHALQDINLLAVHYTEAKARLDCDFTQEALDIIGPIQFEFLKLSGCMPSNEDAISTYYNNTIL